MVRAVLALTFAICCRVGASSGSLRGRRTSDDFCQDKIGLFAAPPSALGNDDCRGYYNCFSGNEPLQLCPGGTRFHDNLKVCDWSTNVDCHLQESTPAPTPPSTPAPTPALTPAPTPVPTPSPTSLPSDSFCEGKQGIFAAPPCVSGNVDCRGYYNCFHGSEPITLCSSGTRFNSVINNCDWKVNVECSVTCEPTSAPTPAPTPVPTPSAPPTPAPVDEEVIGYWCQTWTGHSCNGASIEATLGIAFNGWCDTDAALLESTPKFSALTGVKYISVGGGNHNGAWSPQRIQATTDDLRAGKFNQWEGLAVDVEHCIGSGLGPGLQGILAAAKEQGMQTMVTVSHNAPFDCVDAESLMNAFFQDSNIDFLSPQLYTSGTELVPDWALTATAPGITWDKYGASVAKIVPSIVDATHYKEVKEKFAEKDVTTHGYVQWALPPL